MPGNSLDRRLIKQGPRFDVSVVVSRRINREGVIPADPRHRIGRSFSSRVRKVVMGGALAIAVSDDFVPDRNRPLGNLIPRPAIHLGHVASRRFQASRNASLARLICPLVHLWPR